MRPLSPCACPCPSSANSTPYPRACIVSIVKSMQDIGIPHNAAMCTIALFLSSEHHTIRPNASWTWSTTIHQHDQSACAICHPCLSWVRDLVYCRAAFAGSPEACFTASHSDSNSFGLQVDQVINSIIFDLIMAAESSNAIKSVPGHVSSVWRAGRRQGLHVVTNDPYSASDLVFQCSRTA
jgi:hypothetical protein